jgi:hypothetical protein
MTSTRGNAVALMVHRGGSSFIVFIEESSLVTVKPKVIDNDQLQDSNGRMNASMAIKELAIIYQYSHLRPLSPQS